MLDQGRRPARPRRLPVPGTPVVVELLGYRFHRTKQQMARDAERLNALVLDGFTPYQFTYDQVVEPPGGRASLAALDRAPPRASVTRERRPQHRPAPGSLTLRSAGRGGQVLVKPS